MFKELRNKFILLNMVIISIVMITSFTVIFITTSSRVHRENNDKLNNVLESPIVMKFNNTNSPYISKVPIIPKNYSLSFNVLLDKDYNIINIHSYIDMPLETYEELINTAIHSSSDTGKITIEDTKWLYKLKNTTNEPNNFNPMRPSIINDAIQLSFLDVTESYTMLSQLFFNLIIIAFIMLFIILGISIFFAKRAVTPVELAYDKQKQFIADASHELKTPLAVISANSDALIANKEETIESQLKWIDYIKAETDRMSKLVNGLLYLAKTDNKDFITYSSLINISEIIRDILLSMEVIIFEKGLNLTQKLDQEIIINCDKEKLIQVVTILLDNAIKYTKENGSIEISLTENKQSVTFSIKNTGEGIPKEHLPKLFDRFYRVDSSRVHDGGYGLGLSIAKAAINSMGGEIFVTSTEGEYTTFTFTLNK